jgi:heterodisulfide reductase subunit A-like polyferredoxin
VDTIPGTEHVFEADTVIVAVGQSPELAPFHGITTSKLGTVGINPETMATNQPGIFAGGDAVSGTASVVEAIAAGKRAAASIDAYLQGFIYKETDPLLGINPLEIEVDISPEMERQPRQPMPALSAAERKSWKEVPLGFSEEAAIAEAKRCLHCAGHLCREVCPYQAPQFGAGQNPKMQMCNLCVDRWSQDKRPICVAACPTRAMDAGPMEDLKASHGDVREAEGFTFSGSTRPSVTFKAKKYAPPTTYEP